MKTYHVKTTKISDEDGLEPGAFQSILSADEYAQFVLGDEDESVQHWILKTTCNVDRLLDAEESVISWSES